MSNMSTFPGYMRRGESLDQFHDRCVEPTKHETAQRNEQIDVFVRFLHTQFNSNPNTIHSVIKGGSLGKGTAVRGLADIDLVVVLNGLSKIGSLTNSRPNLLNRLARKVRCYGPWKGGVQLDNRTYYSLCYILNGQKLDVLPALNIEGTYGTREAVYREIGRTASKTQVAMEFSASLSRWQVDFVKTQDENVKRVIRLLKFWKNKSEVDIRSYTLELLTIHEAQRLRHVDTDGLFSKVLTSLADCPSIRVAFDTNYESGRYIGNFQAPYVLDPANPCMNTLHGNDPSSIRKKAKEMLLRL